MIWPGLGWWERLRRAGADDSETIMPAKPTKKSILLKLVSRPGGAGIETLQKATGWQPHSIRAALTGLRKDGHKIERTKGAKGGAAKGGAVYRIMTENA